MEQAAAQDRKYGHALIGGQGGGKSSVMARHFANDTRDQERAVRVARRIRSGTFSINGGNYFHPDVPFGGYRQSGIGRESGVAGMEEFLETKAFGAPVVAGVDA